MVQPLVFLSHVLYHDLYHEHDHVLSLFHVHDSYQLDDLATDLVHRGAEPDVVFPAMSFDGLDNCVCSVRCRFCVGLDG